MVQVLKIAEAILRDTFRHPLTTSEVGVGADGKVRIVPVPQGCP